MNISPLRTARNAQGRAASARRSEPLRVSTVLAQAQQTGGFGAGYAIIPAGELRAWLVFFHWARSWRGLISFRLL